MTRNLAEFFKSRLFYLTFAFLYFMTVNAQNTTDSSSKWRLWYTTPAKKWSSEALPIGNAYMGGMIFGGIEQEQIQYNEKTLWSGGPGAWEGYQGGNRDSAAFWLPAVRNQVQLKNYKAAEKLMLQHLLGNIKAYGAYQNFGNIFFDFSSTIHADSVVGYSRELNLQEGTALVKFKYQGATYRRTYFCSYPDRVLVVRLTCDKPSRLNFKVRMDCAQANSSIRANERLKTIETKGQVSDNKMGFESILKVLNEGGTVQSDSATLTVSGAEAVTVVMTAATEYINKYPSYSGANPHDTVTAILNAATEKSYAILLKNHQKDYQALFGRVSLNLGEEIPNIPTNELKKQYALNPGTALESLMFQYGRYLLISSSRKGTLPANLQGVWNNSNNPPWTCDYHFDINIQMNYFSSEVTNLTECSVPLVDYINSLRAPGRVTAEKHHGVKGGGWVVHPMNNPFGFTAPGWATYWGWAPFNAAWICQNLWDKYKFTGDVDYLRSTIYPIIKEQAEFWQKWLVPDSAGYLVSNPAVSPEHLPIADGPTSDQSMCYELFNDVIEAGSILNVDAEFRKDLIEKRDKLLPLKIGSWGQLQEWKYDWDKQEDKHRHVSHLVSVYQGERINPFRTPEYFQAAKVSLQARDNIKGDVQGWSLIQRMGLWARLLEPEKAYGHFNTLLKSYITSNLFTLTSGVFQIEANLGIPGMMAETMLQSHLKTIHLLPALPKAWSKGEVTGLCARGGFEISMKWNHCNLNQARIISNLGELCVLRNPLFRGKFTLKDSATGKKIKFSKKEDTIVFKTKKGGNYWIERITK